MNFLPPKIDDYVEKYSNKSSDLLQELYRETHQKILNPRMISSAFQGRVLAMFSTMQRPKTILEIGTYTGYATLCLAEGLSKGGCIHTIDHDEELVAIQNKYFERSPYRAQIKQHLGDALEIINQFTTTFDMVFIDADKARYDDYFERVLPRMKKGGVILSDNVLWSGKVLYTPDKKDTDTRVLIDYNKKLATDPRVQTVLLPIRDGLTVCLVK